MLVFLLVVPLWMLPVGVVISFGRLLRERKIAWSPDWPGYLGMLLGLLTTTCLAVSWTGLFLRGSAVLYPRKLAICAVGSTVATLMIALLDGKAKWIAFWCSLLETVLTPILLIIWSIV
jgi:hypothetical protein